MKKNIVPIEDALERVLQLNGYSYDCIDPTKHNDRHQIGVLAQEVEVVFPEAVWTDSEGNKSVSYTMLVAPVIDAVKSLYSMFSLQDRKLASLESELETKTKRIEALEADNKQMKKDLEDIKSKLSL